jgi:hypothetical protein
VDPNNALFSVNLWNAFNTVDRTTNICEGWHSALNKAIGVYSPTIFKVIDFLKKSGARIGSVGTWRCSQEAKSDVREGGRRNCETD